MDYVQRNKDYSDVNLAVENEQDFAQTLDKVYFASQFDASRLDVAFDSSSGYKRVSAARFLIQVPISRPKITC